MEEAGTLDLTRLNKIAIEATAQIAADNEAVAFSRVHMYELSVSCPYEIIIYHVLKHMHAIN